MVPSTDDNDFAQKLSFIFKKTDLVPELSVVKISVRTDLLSSHFHWIYIANFAMTSHHGRTIDK